MRRRAARGGSQPRSAVGPFPGDCARSPCGHHRAVRRSAVMTRSGASFTLALARGGSSMNERQVESGQRVTPLELFFDLVFVFAITQVTGFLAADATWIGLLRGLLLLGALWWAWAAYAWLTNTLNPEEGAVRLFVFGSIGAMLIVSLATRNAFGTDRKSTRLNSSHITISYAVFCLKKKNSPRWHASTPPSPRATVQHAVYVAHL